MFLEKNENALKMIPEPFLNSSVQTVFHPPSFFLSLSRASLHLQKYTVGKRILAEMKPLMLKNLFL